MSRTEPTTISAHNDSDADDFKSELLALIPFLRAFARSLSGNYESADDLAQETLVKAWQSRSAFEPGTNLKAWLFTILRNQF
jgi:RNA polymerase sigma-70 factor (ECF subfamily)